jgi:uncharacterized protein YbjT (DUF2867 family)
MEKVILVVGATGKFGEPVARQLQAEGYHVRVLARNPEKAKTMLGSAYEIVQGDVEHPATLQVPLAGCYGVHINLSGGPQAEDYERIEFQGTSNIVKTAVTLGVKRLTYLSGTSVCEANTWFPPTQAKFKAETAIRDSGLAYTIFRASWFMESLPLFVRGKQATLIGKQPAPVHWLAAKDYARMVLSAYRLPTAENKTLYIYGPAGLTMREALTQYCSIVRPDVKVSVMPIWLVALMAKLLRNAELEDVTRLMGYFNKFAESQDVTEANTLLGAPTTTLQQWCEEQNSQKSKAA